MFVHQLKKRMVTLTAFTVFPKTNHKIAFSKLLRTYILNIVPCPIHGGPIVDYE